MKKVYVILAIAALTLCVASCGNKKKAQEAQEETTECCTKAEGECKGEGECCKAKSAVEEVKDAAAQAATEVKDAAVDAAKEAAVNAVNDAAAAAKDAIKK